MNCTQREINLVLYLIYNYCVSPHCELHIDNLSWSLISKVVEDTPMYLLLNFIERVKDGKIIEIGSNS